MDVYASQKIKCTVKTCGSLILLLFYSSLVDFYYIAPYVHNTLSQVKFLVKSKAVSAKLVQKVFIDINTMLFDTMVFFNGFNRAVIKDVKKHLSGDSIFNERIFLNLSGAVNSNEIMKMCRDYSGSIKFNELINNVKPKVKSDVKVREYKKYGDEVKLEKNDGGLIKFFSFKRATKRNLFLGKEINIKEFIEYQDDYLKSVEKLKILETGENKGEKKEKKEDNNIMEVFDFINNVTNTDKDNEAKIKELSFWDNADNQDNNQKKNEVAELTFGFDFDFDENSKNKKGGENEKKDEKKNIDDIFDFGNDNNKSNPKKEEKKENNIDIFDFGNDNKDNKKENKTEIKKEIAKPNNEKKAPTQIKKDEKKNENIKNNNNDVNQFFQFDNFGKNNNQNNKVNNMQNNNLSKSYTTNMSKKDSKNINLNKSLVPNTNKNTNNNDNNNNNNNQLFDFFDFGKKNQNNDNQNTFNFNQNKPNNAQPMGNQLNNNNPIQSQTNANANVNNNQPSNSGFNFDNFKMMNNNNVNTNANNNNNTNANNIKPFMGFNNMNAFNNQPNQPMPANQNNNNNNMFNNNFANNAQNNFQNNQVQNNVNTSNNKNDNLNNLLANFNFPKTDTNTTGMVQFIPSFPSNNNNSNNNAFNNNFNFNFNPQVSDAFNPSNLSLFSNNKSNAFNFAGFGNNNMLAQFAKQEPEIFVELKEQVCFFYQFTSGNKIINATSKGYLGLMTEADTIKNKDLDILFKTDKIRDNQYIQNDFDTKMKKINDLNYKIHFDNVKKNEKLLNYIVNPNILAQNRILEPLIGGENNILRYKFMYNNNIKKEVLKIELNILYKNVIQNGNMNKSDGNITTNKNNQIIVEYKSKINEGYIEFPLNINVFALVGKISIIVHLKEDVMSEMNVEIKDNFQRILKVKKEAQISYEFS